MKIAVLHRPDDPPSLRIYEDHVLAELADAVEVVRVAPAGPLPGD